MLKIFSYPRRRSRFRPHIIVKEIQFNEQTLDNFTDVLCLLCACLNCIILLI